MLINYVDSLQVSTNLNFRCIGVISASYFFCPKTLKKHFHGTVNCKLNCSQIISRKESEIFEAYINIGYFSSGYLFYNL